MLCLETWSSFLSFVFSLFSPGCVVVYHVSCVTWEAMAESGADHRSRLATSAKAWACRFKARSTGTGVVRDAVTRYFRSPPSESPKEQGQGEQGGYVKRCAKGCCVSGQRPSGVGPGSPSLHCFPGFENPMPYPPPTLTHFLKTSIVVPLMAPPSAGSARGPSPARANPRADDNPPTK
jgi:hypothetical protein